uniref:Uncharacterized protein n=1 Tax=Arundo donax TaxID=35708 RepID=A0A0A9AAF5_ARUDO
MQSLKRKKRSMFIQCILLACSWQHDISSITPVLRC